MFRCNVFRVVKSDGETVFRVLSKSGKTCEDFGNLELVASFLLQKSLELCVSVEVRFGIPYDLTVTYDGPNLCQRLSEPAQAELFKALRPFSR